MGMSSTPPASARPQRPRTDGMRARQKLSRTDRERRRSRRARTGLASGLALAVLFGAAAVVAPRPRLPRPTGPYAIGTTEIGRASCRERAWNRWGDGAEKKKGEWSSYMTGRLWGRSEE